MEKSGTVVGVKRIAHGCQLRKPHPVLADTPLLSKATVYTQVLKSLPGKIQALVGEGLS